jgi:hypothetical protein
MKFKGKEIRDDQMFRRVESYSPHHTRKLVGMKDRNIAAKINLINCGKEYAGS